MPSQTGVQLFLCGLAVVAANNFLTEKEWLAKNTDKTKENYEEMLQAFHKRLATERAEDHASEVFAQADLNGDGKHSKDELVKDLMKVAGFELHKDGKTFIEAGAREDFDKADEDKDGKVTLKEYLAHFKDKKETHFKPTDINGDGAHTFDELIASSSDYIKRSMATSEESAAFYLKFGDKDGDGMLSMEEKEVGLKKHSAHIDFTEMDVNRDGQHSKDEIIQWNMHKNGFQKHENGQYFEEDMVRDFEDADADEDGKVTFKEFLKLHQGADEKSFKAGDYNNDGVHTFDEVVKKPTKESQKALKKWTKDAEVAMSKADKDGNGLVSWDEYKRVSFPDEL